jgi:hypothetical protein
VNIELSSTGQTECRCPSPRAEMSREKAKRVILNKFDLPSRGALPGLRGRQEKSMNFPCNLIIVLSESMDCLWCTSSPTH